MQSSSRSRPFKSGLIGASPITDAILKELIVDGLELREGIKAWRKFFLPTINSQLATQLRSQGVISSARRSAKAEVRGANPRESTISNDEARMSNAESCQRPSDKLPSSFGISCASVPQQLQGGFRKPVFVGASPTRGSRFIRVVM